jgi:hypothetical protein
MLKKEHIKQAIEAIAKRDAEIGYTLDELLSMDRIHPAGSSTRAWHREATTTLFSTTTRLRSESIFFSISGTVPIQERLLVHYGRNAHAAPTLSKRRQPELYEAVAGAIREAGLRLLVNMEIDLALASSCSDAVVGTHGLDPSMGGRTGAPTWSAMKQDHAPPCPGAGLNGREGDRGAVFYSGTVDQGLPACFIRLPFSIAALVQAADINLEFFNIRFLLACWIKGQENNLFACVVDDQIEGLVYLAFKKSLFLQRG